MMISVAYETFSYFPALRTRVAELRGLEYLDPKRKSKVVPVLTLGRWPKATDFTKAADKAEAVMAPGPYFLDLTTDSAHLADQQRVLRNSDGAFSAWREFVGKYECAIPIVQIPTSPRVRDVTKQAQEIERATGRLAFRIRDFSTDTPLVVNALSALDDLRNAIVFIDCQYIRGALTAYVTAAVATINQLRTEFPELVISVLSTSFPASTASFADASQKRGTIEIMERDLHHRIGGRAVAAYGDHGSVHSVIYDESPIMRWVARVDYPRNLDWYFERRPQDQSAAGYVSAAQGVVATDPDIGTRNIWGEEMIKEAATGVPLGKAPAFWISVRVNIHMSRQIDFSDQLEHYDGGGNGNGNGDDGADE